MTDPEIADLVRRIRDQFGWEPPQDYRVVERWERHRSGSEFCRLVGDADGAEILVKAGRDWVPGTARRVYEAMAELHSVISAGRLEHGTAVVPLGWASEPEAVVMAYVGGLDLVTVLRDAAHPSWVSGRMREWVEEAGAMLALFHDSRPGTPDDVERSTLELRELARRVGLGRNWTERMLDDLDPVSRLTGSYGDYGPGNLQCTEHGQLFLLDPPTGSDRSLVHRDLAHFLFELRRQLAGRGYTRTRPLPGRFDSLRSGFLDGYSVHRPTVRLGASDEALIELYELRRSLGMARKRFPGRPGDSAWFAGTALQRRLALTRR